MSRSLKLVFTTALSVLAQVASSHADVAFTTLGTSGTYSSEGELVAPSPAGGPGISWADPFSPTITGNLSCIDLGVTGPDYGADSGKPQPFVLSLEANNPNGGPLTTDVLATGDLLTPSDNSTYSVLTTFSYSGPTLTLFLGTTYWIVLSASGDAITDMLIWNSSTTTTSSDIYFSENGSDFEGPYPADEPMSAFQVNVAPTPEPPTEAMLAVAGIAFIAIAGKKGKIE